MVNAKEILLAVCSALALSGCDRSERNVIVDKPPFFHVELAFSEDRSEFVIFAVRSFAKERDMDFLLAQKTLEPGDFNASANSRSLNLGAMHITAIAKGVDVFAIASGDPTPRQKAFVKEFVGKVREAAAQRQLPPIRRR